MPAPRFAIRNAIICDEVRREAITGKDIIIGAFGGAIRAPSFPITLGLSVWMQLIPTGTGQIPAKVRWIGAQDVALSSTIDSKLNIADVTMSAVAIPPFPIQVQSPGTIKLQIQQDDADWETVAEIRVEQASPST
jgi:hypothetical protein